MVTTEVLAHLSGSNVGIFWGIGWQDPMSRDRRDPVTPFAAEVANRTHSRTQAPEFGRFRVTIFVIQLVPNPNFLRNTR